MIESTCATLYNLVQQNLALEPNAPQMHFNGELLNHVLRQADYSGDITAYSDYQGMEYTDAVFATCLYRPISDSERIKQQELLNRKGEKRQRRIVTLIAVTSMECVGKKMHIIGAGSSISIAFRRFGNAILFRMYLLYVKLASKWKWVERLGNWAKKVILHE